MTSLRQPLCYYLFSAADAADGRTRPAWYHSRMLPAETGLVLAPGRAFHSHLLFGCASQFDRWRWCILWQLPGLLGFPAVREWHNLHPYLAELFGQFFGPAKVRSWPALIWVMPAYVSTSYRLQPWEVQPKDRVLNHAILRPAAAYLPRFPLHFNPGTEHPHLDFDLGSIPFAHSCRHGTRTGRRILWMERQRSGIWHNGRPLRSAFEQNLGLAEPGDDSECLRDGYYPALDGLRVADAEGRTQFLRVRVLIMARVKPLCDWYHGVVDLVFLTFHPESACTIDLNIVARDVEVFLGHYPGLRPLLGRALGLEGRP